MTYLPKESVVGVWRWGSKAFLVGPKVVFQTVGPSSKKSGKWLVCTVQKRKSYVMRYDQIMKKNYLEQAINAAIVAGKSIMEVYMDGEIGVELKADNSPLTKADKASNAIITDFLQPTDLPIISEENKAMDYGIRQHWEKLWIVDPLDGTKEFIERNGEFTVNIALIVHGKPILGVIFIPVSRTLYYADVVQKKAFKALLDPNGTPLGNWFQDALGLVPVKRKEPGTIIVGSRSHMDKKTRQYIEAMRQQQSPISFVTRGSSLKFCMVAEGEADRYSRFAPTMEWDTAAGQAICEAVGLRVISQDTLRPLVYNKPNLANDPFMVEKEGTETNVASNPSS